MTATGREHRWIFPSRRAFLSVAATTAALAARPPIAFGAQSSSEPADIGARILALFDPLPGDKSIKIWGPATDTASAFLVERNASARLFVGSAIKAFVLAERLRQLDSPTIVQTLQTQQIALDAGVWSPDSQTFNPPHLSGLVSERTALEAMIMHSDNTATDMELRQAGPDKVRSLITSMGLTSTSIPDSTRVFFGYLFGAPNYKEYSWSDVTALPDEAPVVHPPLNDTATLASSADDLVTFYSQALQGKLFTHAETLREFRRILMMGDAIFLIPLPLGVNAFAKGGSIDLPGHHALCIAGGMYCAHRWAYYSMIVNWSAPAQTDPATVSACAAALRQAFELVKDALST
ncbi:class A beta-lactamase-related serine hydrolase [Azospirillum canadense]|uniref:class A beta-lactamase-related serine hydrolase n=1 Tax=Azospirillum canadense TaxID=403962 RepID=UPI002227B9DD|nr:class A beta-lactamase-related serine hydrolase [Azospirillum canadense]MCW2239689.1 beta-lactamase class A [Azospirillum canadense]